MSLRDSDRRRSKRRGRVEEHRIVSAVLRPGRRAKLIDASATGVLIETSNRLLPGTKVELHLQTPTRGASLRGRVLRCTVARVRSSFVCYRSAIGFYGHLSWLADEDGFPMAGQEIRSGVHVCVGTTPRTV